MATVGIALGAQQTPPILVRPDFALGPQATATPAQDPSQQDVVTLAARTAENGQTRTTNGDGQFGEAAAFFLAESQSFRAANGSGGSQTAQLPSVPELPVKLTTGAPPQQSAAPNGVDSTKEQAAPAANTLQQGAADSVAANLDTNSAISAASQPSTSASATPLAELAQLDRTLQQIGIDPQSISLFNRMAMLLYANDPAALKILVQTLQSGAQQLTTDSTEGKAGTNRTQAGSVVQNLLSAQAETPNTNLSPNQNGSAAGVQTSLLAQPTFEAQQASSHDVPQINENLSLKLGDLNLTFAAVGASQLVSGSQNTQPGHLLNVTF